MHTATDAIHDARSNAMRLSEKIFQTSTGSRLGMTNSPLTTGQGMVKNVS